MGESQHKTSLWYILEQLKTPIGRSLVDQLCGNSDETLSKLEIKLRKLLVSYGEPVNQVVRNQLVHGITDVVKAVMNNPSVLWHLHKLFNGIREIFSYMSIKCFGENKMNITDPIDCWRESVKDVSKQRKEWFSEEFYSPKAILR